MGWFNKSKHAAGWVVVGISDDEISLVHGMFVLSDKPQILQIAIQAVEPGGDTLATVAKAFDLARFNCATVLGPSDYQFLLVEAPKVSRDELKTAIRWRIKDLLDYHLDDATIDVLDIPVQKDVAARNHSMYAVASKNDTIRRCIASFEHAQIPLSVIDIPETAQRNIAALYEPHDRAVALLYFDQIGGLLTITYKGELYLSRRLEITAGQLTLESNPDPDDARGRVLLEVQRSLDHFERQFSYITVSKLVLGPNPSETGLTEYIRANVEFPVEQIDLNTCMDIVDAPMAQEIQWRLFHLIGASLRHETKIL